MQELARCLAHGGRAHHTGLGRGNLRRVGQTDRLSPRSVFTGLWLFLPGGGVWKEVSRVTALKRSVLSLQEFMPSHRHLIRGAVCLIFLW